MADIEFTEEEQTYLDMGRQGSRSAPEPEPETKAVEQAETQEESAVSEETSAKQESADAAEPVQEQAKEELERDDKGRFKAKTRPPWWEAVPDEAKEYIDNLHAARTSTRRTNQELNQRLQEHEGRWSKAQERLSALEQFRIKAEAPDPEMEPEKHAAYQERIRQEQDAQTKEQQREEQERTERQATYDMAEKQEQALVAEQPDYYEVINAAREVAIAQRARALMDLDIPQSTAEDMAVREIDQYVWSRAEQMQKVGGNFAKLAYREARQILDSVRPKDQAKEAQPEPEKKADQLKPLADGKQAARSPKASGANKELTLEELASMTDEEFHKHADDMKKLRVMFGA